MNEVVLLQLISSSFWLILVVLIIRVFRNQLKDILASLASFEIAGTHFNFRDKKATLESYAILSDVLLDILQTRGRTIELASFISEANTQRIRDFAFKYADEVDKDDQNLVLLKNIAAILARKERAQEAGKIYDVILEQIPEEVDANSLKAVALLNSRVPDNVRSAEQIYDRFLDRYPTWGVLWWNRALTRSQLKKYDQALSDLKRALDLLDLDALEELDVSLENELIIPLKSAKPSEFKQLEDEVSKAKAKETSY
jgi:tetratricopeptide (TPR) repeat protein